MKNIIGITLLALIANLVQAQTNAELNGLINQSFNYFPKVKEAEKAYELGDVRVNIARGAYLPSVAGNASYNYIDPVGQASFPTGPDQTRSIQFQPQHNYNANVSLNQVIWDFGKTQSQIEKAKSDLQLQQYNTDALKLQLASQVANVYYTLIYLKQAIVVQDSIISFYEQNKKIVEGKIRHGDALQIDLLNIDNSLEQEKSRKIEFQRLHQRQLALLQYTTGAASEPTVSVFDFQWHANGASPEQQNPEVLAATQRVLSAEAERKSAQRHQLPSLNLAGSAGFRNGYQPDIDQTRFNYLAGVTLSMPIFQGRRLRQGVELNQRVVELNELSKANLLATIRKDMASNETDIRAYHQQIQLSSIQVKSANEALRLNQVRYQKGVSTYLDLVYASTNLQRAMLNKLQYEYQYCLSQVEKARLSGDKFWAE
ncbi:MAG: TolC family protein [Bacteroidota bacterium]